MKKIVSISFLLLGSMALKAQTNHTKIILDYNGNGAAASTDANVNWGVGYSEGNIALIKALRDAVLPVRLISFTADKYFDKVYLKWKTLAETDNQRFEVWKSADNAHFTFLAQVAAGGNISSPKNYTCLDEQPGSGLSYYQLRQIDVNGNVSVLALASVTINSSSLDAWFSTAGSESKLSVYSDKEADMVIKVIDLSGRTLYVFRSGVRKGYTQLDVPAEISSGLYVVSVDTPLQSLRKKIFLVR